MVDKYNLDISFVVWLKVGVPLSEIMLACSGLIFTRLIFKVELDPSQDTKDF